MTPALAAPLREALLRADFLHDAVGELLGEDAHRALQRNETVPGLRRTADGSPLATLTRLFLLQRPVPEAAAERALPGLVDPLANAGLLERSVSEVAARLDCRPYGTAEGEDLWVVSDLTPGLDGAATTVGPEHVLGISSASTSLAQLTLRAPVGTALDLGTGCGVQALHLAGHSDRVVATDVNRRALDVARFNMALNEIDAQVEVREGSFFGAVAGERFDLIATNPPFVISPATGQPFETGAGRPPQEPRLVYRDSGLPGDEVVEHIVRTAPQHLTDGGWCQVLANWVISADRPWDERLGAWLPADCDAFVVQREVLDPAAYVELWLKDSGHHPSTGGDPDEYLRRYDTWLAWLTEQQVAGIGFGWINLRKRSEVSLRQAQDTATGSTNGDPEVSLRQAQDTATGSTNGDPEVSTGGAPLVEPFETPRSSAPQEPPVETPATHELLDWPYDVEQPIAPAIAEWGAATGTTVTADSHLATPSDVHQETFGPVGAEDPATIVVRRQRGLRRARQVDTVLAAALGACDGELTIGQILGAVAHLLERDAAEVTEQYLPEIASLVGEGFLAPVDG